jgi:hypothetical protein
VFVRDYGFTVTEHDPERPWIVHDQRHETVQLDEQANFYVWAAQHYPHDRFTVELDPWGLAR